MPPLRRNRAASTDVAPLDDGKPLATARPTRREHFASARGPHPRAKTVHARTPTCLWLIGALHDRIPSPARNGTNKRSRGIGWPAHESINTYARCPRGALGLSFARFHASRSDLRTFPSGVAGERSCLASRVREERRCARAGGRRGAVEHQAALGGRPWRAAARALPP